MSGSASTEIPARTAASVTPPPPDTPAEEKALSPLLQQYVDLKAENPHALLLFRCGDFYETFFEDAVVAARELQITLTARGRAG
ncbi:MAG TPA: hypothetical protein VIV61_06595, partial [Candidatus Ozemobacteraceae bacterium]